jgi:hypothetical protein
MSTLAGSNKCGRPKLTKVTRRRVYLQLLPDNLSDSLDWSSMDMVVMSELSLEEWEALKRLLHGDPVRQIDGQTVQRLTDIGALQKKRDRIELSCAAMRLLTERMARISRARKHGDQTWCH